MFPPTWIPDALLQLDVHLSGQLGNIWQPFAQSECLLRQEEQRRELRSSVCKIDRDGWTRRGSVCPAHWPKRGVCCAFPLYVDLPRMSITFIYRTIQSYFNLFGHHLLLIKSFSGLGTWRQMMIRKQTCRQFIQIMRPNQKLVITGLFASPQQEKHNLWLRGSSVPVWGQLHVHIVPWENCPGLLILAIRSLKHKNKFWSNLN